jgi:hypothetical protein
MGVSPIRLDSQLHNKRERLILMGETPMPRGCTGAFDFAALRAVFFSKDLSSIPIQPGT